METAAAALLDFLILNVDGLDEEQVRADAAPYLASLRSLDSEVETLLADIPADRRILVTNHDVFAYFADRYDFEVVGTVIPAGSTSTGVSASTLSDLADTVRREGVPAIFVDSSASSSLAETLAAEVGDVQIVQLYSESLGAPGTDGATYLGMVRSNAERIAAALGGQ